MKGLELGAGQELEPAAIALREALAETAGIRLRAAKKLRGDGDHESWLVIRGRSDNDTRRS
jgi:hypothetical protein